MSFEPVIDTDPERPERKPLARRVPGSAAADKASRLNADMSDTPVGSAGAASVATAPPVSAPAPVTPASLPAPLVSPPLPRPAAAQPPAASFVPALAADAERPVPVSRSGAELPAGRAFVVDNPEPPSVNEEHLSQLISRANRPAAVPTSNRFEAPNPPVPAAPGNRPPPAAAPPAAPIQQPTQPQQPAGRPDNADQWRGAGQGAYGHRDEPVSVPAIPEGPLAADIYRIVFRLVGFAGPASTITRACIDAAGPFAADDTAALVRLVESAVGQAGGWRESQSPGSLAQEDPHSDHRRRLVRELLRWPSPRRAVLALRALAGLDVGQVTAATGLDELSVRETTGMWISADHPEHSLLDELGQWTGGTPAAPGAFADASPLAHLDDVNNRDTFAGAAG